MGIEGSGGNIMWYMDLWKVKLGDNGYIKIGFEEVV
jgi:hypothetical protein